MSIKYYSDLVPDYGEYKRLQTVDYQSFESENSHWKTGQTRYIHKELVDLNRDSKLLDIACGDGVGLRELIDMKFTNLTGVEFNHEKALRARTLERPPAISADPAAWTLSAFRVIESDMHTLPELEGELFDVIYSSHTLEHAYYPRVALERWRELLAPNGVMFVVLPYPDLETAHNNMVHGGKFEIGLTQADGGETVKKFFETGGMKVLDMKFDKFREDEIWLRLGKC